MDKGTLGVHQVKLVIQSSPGLGNGGCVAQHAHGTFDWGHVATGDDGRRLVVDADLEASGAPVDELNGAFGLDVGNGGVDVFGDDVATVQQTTGHVLAVTRITLDHLVSGLEARRGNLHDGMLFMQVAIDTWKKGLEKRRTY